MNYINKEKKKVVGRNNQSVSPILIDFNTLGSISFQVIDSNNKIQQIPSATSYYLAGGLKGTTLFYSNIFSISSGILNFVVDTYTEPFLSKIKSKYTEINLQIGLSSTGLKQLLLRDIALANPRVYIEGLPPSPLSSYYTKEETDALLSGKVSKEYVAANFLSSTNPSGYGRLKINSLQAGTNCSSVYFNNGKLIYGSFAQGDRCAALGRFSHAQGQSTSTILGFANGAATHSQGWLTVAQGGASHAQGYKTYTSGFASHTEGFSTSSYVQVGHVEGIGTITYNPPQGTDYPSFDKPYVAQHVEGKWNIPVSGYQLVVGGGSSDADRQNIFLRDWDGNSWQSGAVSASHFYDITLGKFISGGTDGNFLSANNPIFTGILQAEDQSSFNVDQDGYLLCQNIDCGDGTGIFMELTVGTDGITSNGNVSVNGNLSATNIFYNGNNLTTALNNKLNVNNPSGTGTLTIDKLQNGNNCVATGTYSHAEGGNTNASGQYSHTEGHQTYAYSKGSHAQGLQTIASAEYQHVEGKYNIPLTDQQFIVGGGSDSYNRKNIYTRDWNGNSWQSGAVSALNFSVDNVLPLSATGDIETHNKTTISNTKISINQYYIDSLTGYVPQGDYFQVDIGINNVTSGAFTHTYGRACSAIYTYSYADGLSALAAGAISHAEGRQTSAFGRHSHAEGRETIASGQNSHAEGSHSISNGVASHAEGRETIADNTNSHAEGYSTLAAGEASHSEGQFTSALAAGSHVEGCGTKTYQPQDKAKKTGTYSYQHIEGKYNSLANEDLKQMQYVVGGGSSDSDRKTIYKRDWNGNVWTSGVVSASHFYDTTLGKVISGGTGGNYLSANNPKFTGILYNTDLTFYVDSDLYLSDDVNTLDSGNNEEHCILLGRYNELQALQTAVLCVGNGSQDDDRNNSLTIDINGSIYSAGTIFGNNFQGSTLYATQSIQSPSFKVSNYLSLQKFNYKTQTYSSNTVAINASQADFWQVKLAVGYLSGNIQINNLTAGKSVLVYFTNGNSNRTLWYNGEMLCSGATSTIFAFSNINGTVCRLGEGIKVH